MIKLKKSQLLKYIFYKKKNDKFIDIIFKYYFMENIKFIYTNF